MTKISTTQARNWFNRNGKHKLLSSLVITVSMFLFLSWNSLNVSSLLLLLLLYFSIMFNYVLFFLQCVKISSGVGFFPERSIVNECAQLLQWLSSTNKDLRQYHGNIKSLLYFFLLLFSLFYLYIHVLPLYLRKLLPQVFFESSDDVAWVRMRTIYNNKTRKCLGTKIEKQAAKPSKWNKIIIIVIVIVIIVLCCCCCCYYCCRITLAYCTAFQQ